MDQDVCRTRTSYKRSENGIRDLSLMSACALRPVYVSEEVA